MKNATNVQAAGSAHASSSRARAAVAICPAPWYGTATKGIDVAMFDHKLDARRPKEASQ